MTQPLGEEFILVRPSLAGFKAELQAQVAAALAGVGPQIAAAQSRLRQTAGTATLAGLPGATNAATAAQAGLIVKTKSTDAALRQINGTTTRSSEALKNFSREAQTAETAVGRTTRGLVAATAASTGFFRAVSFASGAFLVGALAGAAIATGVQKFRDLTIVAAQTNAIIKATGGAANVTARQVEDLARRQAELTGTDDALITRGADVLLTFRSIRNEVGAGNDVFTRAVKGAQDISTVFNTDLRGSAVQLGKALQDPIRGVTALRRSGITLSQSQRDLIKQLVTTGQLLTAQKLILGEVEKQVGGTAEAIGRTLPGRLDILKERAKTALGEYVKDVSESRTATQTFSETMHGLGDAIGAVAAVAKASIGTFAAFSRVLASIPGVAATFGALGGLRSLVRTLAIAAAAFGGLKLALGTATAAQALYTRATTIATEATIAEGIAAERAALAAGATKAAALAAGEAAAASAARVGLAAGAVNLLTGPVGIAIGITALAVAFIKLRQNAANAPGTLNATKRALDDLSNSVERANKLRGGIAAQSENVSLARFDVLAAQRTTDRAQGAVDRSTAQPGSIEQIALANRLTKAQNELDKANQALVAAEQKRDTLEGQFANNQRARQSVIAETTKKFQDQIAALNARTPTPQSRLGRLAPDSPLANDLAARQIEAANERLAKFNALMDGLIAKGSPLEQKVGRVLKTIRENVGALSNNQIKLVVSLVGKNLSVSQILSLLGQPRGTESIRARGLPSQPDTFQQQIEDEFKAAQATVAQEQKRLAALKAIRATREQDLNTANQALQTARDAVTAAQQQQHSAQEALADAKQAAADARQTLKDTIAAGKASIAQAVNDAKSNLDSLGQSIAQLIGQATTSGATITAAQFRKARAALLAGKGGPETQGEAQRLAFQATQANGTGSADALLKAFGNLTRSLTDHKITLAQFNQKAAVLIPQGTVARVRRTQGDLAADQLAADIKALRQQAVLSLTGPQKGATGITAAIVNPATAIAQAGRDVVGAQRALKRSFRDLGDSQDALKRSNEDLRKAEVGARRAEAKQREANTKAIIANTKVLAQFNKLNAAKDNQKKKAKPAGAGAKDAGDLNLVGANSP